MFLASFSFVPHGLEPISFLVMGWLAVLLLGAAKSGFGGSIGMLSAPMMILACGDNSTLANGIMLPLLIACDYVSMALWWRKWDYKNIRLLVPGMVAGIGAGWLVLWLILSYGGGKDAAKGPSNILNLCIGTFALGFVALQAVRSLRGEITAFRPTHWHGAIAGSSAGFVSTLAHTAGPITNMFLLPQQMPKGQFVATTVLYYWIGNQVKLIPYYALSLLTGVSLGADLALLPAALAGAALGVFLHNKVNQRMFMLIVYVLLAGFGGYIACTAAKALFG